MIDPKELRIGNHATYYGNPLIVEPGDFSKLDWGRVDPIPLTPEVLEAAGFLAVPEKEGIYQTADGAYQIAHFHFGRNAVFYIRYDHLRGYCYVSGQIYFLHQLQNLYYAVEGAELTVNLPAAQEK